MHPNIIGFSAGYHEISTYVTNLRTLPKISTQRSSDTDTYSNNSHRLTGMCLAMNLTSFEHLVV
jgi:hypothetical protein